MRTSGILLHIASLPDKYGVGSLGCEADNFIRFLTKSKQTYWQILPINPVDCVNSPYASPSAFAGNYLLIDIDKLAEEGLVTAEELAELPRCASMDYERAKTSKKKILKKAFFNFFAQPNLNDFFKFIDENADWLEDYALFSAIKEARNGDSWQNWEIPLQKRESEALKKAMEEYEESIDYYRFEQFIFYKQWNEFRQKLADAKIKLVGDIPFYVAYDSVEVWKNQKLFQLDSNRLPKVVAGVAPDYFSKNGQLWGNPIYNYKQMSKDNYQWWKERLRHCAKLFDVLRIDHFRAFDSYYVVKYGRENAKKGRWIKNNGEKILSAILPTVPSMKVIAEDLGDIPQSVYALRDKFCLDGMKIMQFAFDGNKKHPFLPENFNTNCVAYLGTHDNSTTAGWLETLDHRYKKIVLDYLKLQKDASVQEITERLVESLIKSPADTVIISMQDLNCLDDNFRMNTPGTLGCWNYMESAKSFSMATALKLEKLTLEAKRAQ